MRSPVVVQHQHLDAVLAAEIERGAHADRPGSDHDHRVVRRLRRALIG
jgi:hypothetical protein